MKKERQQDIKKLIDKYHDAEYVMSCYERIMDEVSENLLALVKEEDFEDIPELKDLPFF